MTCSPCDSWITTYFGDKAVDRNATGEAAFRAQLFLGVLGQAIEMKGQISAMRSDNRWGVVVWQLNEIWPTGGWGSLEYGTVGYTPGQVVGGRWKPVSAILHCPSVPPNDDGTSNPSCCRVRWLNSTL